MTVFVVLTNLLVLLMSTSRYSLLSKNKSWLSGSSISMLQAIQSVNRLLHRNALYLVVTHLEEIGYTDSSGETQVSNSGGPQDLIPSMPNALITQQSHSILMCSKRSLKHVASPGITYATWMRRDINKVEDMVTADLNTSCHAASVFITSSGVIILNLSQLSSMSVQMVQTYYCICVHRQGAVTILVVY